MQKRVYCSGYWTIPGNQKRSDDHYSKGLSDTLDLMRGSTLHFYSDSTETLDSIAALGTSRDVVVHAHQVKIADLPGWNISERLMACAFASKLDRITQPPSHETREKGAIHYWRDLQISGADTYRQLLAIWMSKIPLTISLIAKTTDSDILVWADASLSRFNGKRSNWDVTQLTLDPARLSHYASPMQFQGIPLPLNASFLAAGPDRWLMLQSQFNIATERATATPYAHDEETILAQCVWAAPDTFHCLGFPQEIPRRRPLLSRFKGAARRAFKPASR